MKKIILSICTLVLISLFHISCNKEDIKPNKKEGSVEFGFSLKAPLHSGAQKSSMKAPAVEPAAVVVSIKKANSNSVYTMQKVDLYNMNGYYISKPLSFLPGSYTVEQFFVVDAAGNVMYATPFQGSPKAYLVSEPLPISFTVSKDVVTKIVPEVLSTEDSTPEDFGYSTVSFEVVNTFDFLIGVFVYNESTQNFELTNANLTIVSASKTIFTDTLAAITNKVTLNDGYDNYILSVTKDGYKTWTDTLTSSELKLYFRSEDNGPLKVILEKGIESKSIKFTTNQTSLDLQGTFQLNASNQNANLTINWGDGIIENIILSDNIFYNGKHRYSKTGIYEVNIYGEVEKLFSIGLYQNNSVTSIDIAEAVNLKYLGLHENKISKLDLTHNPMLIYLNCSHNTISSVDLSKNDKIEQLFIEYNSIQSVNLSNKTNLNRFVANYNNILELDFSDCYKIETVQCLDNINLSKVVIGQKDSFKQLTVTNSALTSLDVSGCPNLDLLHCSSNKIKNIDVSNCRKLVAFIIERNLLTTLDVSNNIDLVQLGFFQNQLTTIDLSNNTKLRYLSCSGNQLTSLDISKNTLLERLACDSNPLTSLDVSKNTLLTMLTCSGGQSLTSLDVSKNILLRELYVHANPINFLELMNNKEIRKIYIPNLTAQGIESVLSTLVSFKRYSNNSGSTFECTLALKTDQVLTSQQGLNDLNTLRDTYKWEIRIY